MEDSWKLEENIEHIFHKLMAKLARTTCKDSVRRKQRGVRGEVKIK